MEPRKTNRMVIYFFGCSIYAQRSSRNEEQTSSSMVNGRCLLLWGLVLFFCLSGTLGGVSATGYSSRRCVLD